MSDLTNQTPTTFAWCVKASEFGWRAPFIAAVVLFVGLFVGVGVLEKENATHIGDFARITQYVAATIIAAGVLCALTGLFAAFTKGPFRIFFPSLMGLILNGGLIWGIFVFTNL